MLISTDKNACGNWHENTQMALFYKFKSLLTATKW